MASLLCCCAPTPTDRFSCTKTAVADVSAGGGVGPLNCSQIAIMVSVQAKDRNKRVVALGSFAIGAAHSMFTAAITRDNPKTPVHGASLTNVRLSICV